MSGGLAPSKSTVYVSNLPFDLKNNDLHKIFEKHGKLVKVTILKDKTTRKSKGVAFLLYLNKEDAKKCADATDNQEIFGRKLKASIAKDNGRSSEFIRRKNYPDKTQCYECGERGHLSYNCEKNLLGAREPPPKKIRKRKKNDGKKGDTSYYDTDEDENYDETTKETHDEDNEVGDEETLSAVIAMEQEKKDLEDYRIKVATGNYESPSEVSISKKRIKKSAYFSDEEESE